MNRLSDETICDILLHKIKNDRTYVNKSGCKAGTIDVYPLLDAQIAECQKEIDKVQTPEGLKKELKEYLTKLGDSWENYVCLKSKTVINMDDATEHLSSIFKQSILPAVEAARKETACDFKIVWTFMNQERNKGKDKEVIITAMDMIHDYIVGNFPEALKQEG